VREAPQWGSISPQPWRPEIRRESSTASEASNSLDWPAAYATIEPTGCRFCCLTEAEIKIVRETTAK